MELDELLKKHVGQFGRYQVFLLLFISIEELFIALHSMASVFLVGKPDHHCQIQNTNLINCSQNDWLHMFIPTGADGQFSSCKKYVWNDTELLKITQCPLLVNNGTVHSQANLSQGHMMMPCDSWDYDDSLFKSTIVTEWDLVCDKQYLASNVAGVFMIGRLVGCLVFGPITDWIGRKPVVVGAGIVNVIAGVGMALVPNLTVVFVMRFLLSCCGTAKTTAAFILLTEYVGPDWRIFTMTFYFLYWVAGYMILPGLAYFIRDWRMLQLVISTPEIIYFILFFFFIPESPRWLLTKGKEKAAKATLRLMAKWNRREYPEDIEIYVQVKKKTGSLLSLLRTPGIRKVTLIMWMSWFCTAFVYYGLSFNTSNLGGNPYVNCLIAGAIEGPVYIFLAPTLKKFGRVYPYIICMVLSGISLLCIMAIPSSLVWLVVTVAMIGKVCICGSFQIVWYYSAEVYPTEIRSIGINSASALARVGATLAAYVELLGNIHPALHFAVFGVSALISGILALALPETRGEALKQTVGQVEAFIQADPGKLCCRRQHKKVDTAEAAKCLKDNNYSANETAGSTAC